MCKYTPNKKGIRTKLNNFCALIVCIDLNCIIQRTFVRYIFLNGSLNSKKIPSFGIENIFTGNPFCIVNNGSDVISVQTDWDIDNGGYRVKNIKYPAGTVTNLTVSLSLPANSIVIVDVNTLNGENIDIQGSLIRSNFTSSPKNWNLSIKFTGRTNQILTDIRYMPLVIHLG